ncbi:uncharacterized protein ACLA_087160 [Aspergillus clavatus NRRL 1]|uniref:Uncharacterized protein n=1 Tax=Aspergillus clavatus (strain ATCC 1007 / CBS 513.65 / DSM 816 / NCTC 3887 / NRRL 1 / QM 1276 / 107) TaxID=344612 RepID=A1CUM6_ASPCL|nr:uncharacterized protein ACLA_087160 [Aspergillus clavatus NRRL 1]EAW07013.1 conserved hypothetical protein [Aspergillus clavatus NRRL 1]
MSLLRFLSLAAVCLSSVAASLPDHSPTSHTPTIPQSRHLYRIDILCSPCAFAEAQCSQELEPPSYITLDLSTTNHTLYVNHEPIFPVALPLQFPAVKYWDSGKQPVTVSYAVDIQPLPAQPGAVFDETLHLLLNLRLFDQSGRAIAPSSIAVGLTSHQETLRIIKVERSPVPHPGHESSPWRPFKHHVRPFLEALTGTNPADHRPSHRPHRRPPASHYHNTMPWSSRDRSFMRLVRPVILPALLGVAAGLCACLTGFVAGKVMVAVYRCWYPQPDVPTIQLECIADEEQSFVSEKRWLSV